MTGQERDYEAILSRVLHTTTDQLEPVGDGLTKIRARLSEPWLKRQWSLLRSEFTLLRWLVVVRCESLFSTLRSRSAATTGLTAGATAPGATASQEADGGPLRSLLSISTLVSGKRQHRSAGPAMAWLRPALAVAGAVVLVVAGVFALGSIREGFIVGLENATGTNNSSTGQQGQNGNTQGGGSALTGSSRPSQGRSGMPSPGTSAAHNKLVPSPGPCVSPSPQSDGSPSPSPTSATPTPSPSPTSPSPSPTPTSPSPSPSTSAGPLTSGMAGPTQEAIGTTALVMCLQTPGPPASPTNQATSGP